MSVIVDLMVISEGLWTQLLLICLPCGCVRVRVCVFTSHNEVPCGELMKFFSKSSLWRCQVTSGG